MYFNYAAGPELTRLAKVNAAKNNFKKLSYVKRYMSIDSVTEMLHTLEHLSDQDGVERLFQLTLIDSVRRSQDAVAEWTAEKEGIISELDGAVHHRTLSTIFTERNVGVIIFEYQGTYVVLQSAELSIDDYFLVLACMLMDYKDDEDFVRRASSAIQNHTYMELTAEELDMIDEYDVQKKLSDLRPVITKMYTEQRPTERIRMIKDRINSLMYDLKDAQNELRELELKDFAIMVQTDEKNNNDIQDSLEYIQEMKEYISDVSYANDELRIVLMSYLTIPLQDQDFFKESALESPDHPLHAMPSTTRMLKDVMNRKIRVPIQASYLLQYGSSKSIEYIRSLDRWRSNTAIYSPNEVLVNHHIDTFNCFDTYKRMMFDAIRNVNFIALFETMLQCTRTVNVFDTPVISRIIEDITQLSNQTPIQIYQDNEWTTIRLGEYYEKIESESE